MKTSTFSALLIALTATFASCNSGIDKKNEDSSQQFTPAATPVLPSVDADAAAPAASQPAALAVNPEHGAPGHRCDLPVGAPLSAAPAASQGSPVNAAPINLTSPVQSGSVVRLNPPHGQPGHDCAVEVGKPLP